LACTTFEKKISPEKIKGDKATGVGENMGMRNLRKTKNRTTSYLNFWALAANSDGVIIHKH
jgi:hypothetical protein